MSCDSSCATADPPRNFPRQPTQARAWDQHSQRAATATAATASPLLAPQRAQHRAVRLPPRLGALGAPVARQVRQQLMGSLVGACVGGVILRRRHGRGAVAWCRQCERPQYCGWQQRFQRGLVGLPSLRSSLRCAGRANSLPLCCGEPFERLQQRRQRGGVLSLEPAEAGGVVGGQEERHEVSKHALRPFLRCGVQGSRARLAEIRSTDSVPTECKECITEATRLCGLVQSGLGLRVCGAVEGDGLS